MSQSAAFRRLLDVLRQRDIPLGRDDVGWAFESPKTRDEIVRWVEEHLNNSTLLSKDELRLYQNLTPSIDDGLDPTDPIARPIRDDELRTAINALKQSTAVIEKHKRSLETQKQALIELKAEKEGHDVPSSYTNPQQDANQQRLRESSQLVFAIEDLQRSNYEQLQQTYGQSTRAADLLVSAASERLERHDQVLDALAKLASKVRESRGSAGVNMNTIDQWCHALATLREQAIKVHIDTVMLNELYVDSGPALIDEGDEETASEIEELRAEVKSLHDEILSVAKMVIANDLREPILKGLQKSTATSKQGQSEWFEYVLATQEHMISHLQFIYQQAVQLQSYNMAVKEISTYFKNVSGHDTQNTVASIESVPPGTPRSGGVPKLKSSMERSSTAGIEQALRRFNIGNHPKDLPQTAQALAENAIQTRAKLLSQYASTLQADLKILGQVNSSRDQELQAVLSKLYASSDYGSVRLTDKGLDARLQELDEKIADTAKDYARADAARRHNQSLGLLSRLKNLQPK